MSVSKEVLYFPQLSINFLLLKQPDASGFTGCEPFFEILNLAAFFPPSAPQIWVRIEHTLWESKGPVAAPHSPVARVGCMGTGQWGRGQIAMWGRTAKKGHARRQGPASVCFLCILYGREKWRLQCWAEAGSPPAHQDLSHAPRREQLSKLPVLAYIFVLSSYC